MTRSVVLLCVTASLFSGVLCSSDYHSYHEALTDDNKRCVGECQQGQCVSYCAINCVQGEVRTKPCHPTSNKTKVYTSLDNHACRSNCDKFGTANEWCITGDDEIKWEFCSRAVALKGRLRYTTRDDFLTCYDECGKHGFETYDDWCHTVKIWKYCNEREKNEKIFVPEYPTQSGNTCVTPCMFYLSKTATFCYDNAGLWTRCYLNPQYEPALHSLTSQLRSNCINKFGTYTSNGYEACSNYLSRAKRDVSCDLDVSTIAERHRADNPSDIVRVIDPREPIVRDTNPILSYTMMPRRVSFGDRNNVANIDLPLVLEARLTQYTLLPEGSKREEFHSYLNNHYWHMSPDRRLRNVNNINNNYDEVGYLLGSVLGGPMEIFNIFPQTWRLNKGDDSAWYKKEQHMVDFLRNHDDRYIEFLAVLGYKQDNNSRLITRPDYIGIRLRFYENNILVDRHGNQLNSFEDNETENMFFSNDPDEDCHIW
ncbi:hypothetical protein B5X24_HaOG215623 [Helicoverpa armigera]|nr:hypothetical protein B5X24_HaOG215623 [Helicoverpa armigera]